MTRSIDPIVSTEWLQDRLPCKELAIIDIRWPEQYAAGHIPGAISAPFGLNSAWAVSDDELILELPVDKDLFKVIGDCGLTASSKVVISSHNCWDTPTSRSMTARWRPGWTGRTPWSATVGRHNRPVIPPKLLNRSREDQ